MDIVRLIVATVVLASSWDSKPNALFLVGCVLAAATIFYAIMGRWPPGEKFVQSFLVESSAGMRAYVLCAIIPMGVLLILATGLACC